MTDTSDNATPADDEVRTEAAEELPAFGYAWPCSACGAVVKGYALLCKCGEC